MSITPAAANRNQLRAINARIAQFVSGSHALSLLDQAIVSATSFIVLVMIGRSTDPHQLGSYAIGASVLALLIAAQDSLITRPYSVQLHKPAGTSAEYAFSALSLSVLLSTAAAFVTGVIAVLFYAFDADHELIGICWALAGAIPFVLTREFARRIAFAHLVVGRALRLDCTVAALVLVALAALASYGRLSAAAALTVTGLACGVATLGSLYLTRRQFTWRFCRIKSTFWRSWRMGKWFLSSQIAIQAQGYMTPWLALVIAGAAASGVYTACTSIVAFANPLLYGYFNVLLPKFVRTLRQQGGAALRRQAFLDALRLAGLMGAFALFMFVYGQDLMRFLYRGESFTGFGNVLSVLASATVAAAVGAPAAIALAALERARTVAAVTAFTAILHFVLIATLLPQWGLIGAAYGVLAAEMTGTIGRWVAFLRLSPQDTVAG